MRWGGLLLLLRLLLRRLVEVLGKEGAEEERARGAEEVRGQQKGSEERRELRCYPKSKPLDSNTISLFIPRPILIERTCS